MSTSHGSLSNQSRKRLQGGELIHKGYDNEEIASILDVGESTVKFWRRKLNKNNNDLACLARKKVLADRPVFPRRKSNASRKLFWAVPSTQGILRNAGHRESLLISSSKNSDWRWHRERFAICCRRSGYRRKNRS